MFNALTGLNQKISNVPGTTIEKKKGTFRYGDQTIDITDLPGTYSIHPKGEDEVISVEFLLDSVKNKIDTVLFVADASNLSRNMLLYTQVADLGYPIVLALNMTDLAERKGIRTDVQKLSAALNVIVCPINARQDTGLDKLREMVVKVNSAYQTTFFEPSSKGTVYVNYREYLSKHIAAMRQQGARYPEQSGRESAGETTARYRKIDKIVDECQKKEKPGAWNLTQRIDQFLLHPVYGFLAFFATLFIIFQFIFKVAEYPMQWIENLFGYLSALVHQKLPEGILSSLLADGIIPGIGGVVVFLPQIILLFLLLALLEDSGYMTRVSFITDRLMRKFGLNGKSVVPLIGGMACAIPSIMATRNIENKKDRLITILVTPLMSCSARLPVYTLLVSMLFIQETNSWLDARGLILLGMYLLGFLAALLFAFIFKLILKQNQKSFFVLELPDYRKPRMKNIYITVKEKASDFVFNAGKIILVVSIVLWCLASFAPGDQFEGIDKKYSSYTEADKLEKVRSEKLEVSYAGILGKAIEPAIRPLGYDWKIGIALITSFAAREVFVGTIATIYSVGNADDEKTLSKVLSEQRRANGTPLYSMATIMSLLIFYAFAMQCSSTLAVTYRETGSIKWPIVQFLYMSGFAYLVSLLVFHFFS